jgi:hypothetical protein
VKTASGLVSLAFRVAVGLGCIVALAFIFGATISGYSDSGHKGFTVTTTKLVHVGPCRVEAFGNIGVTCQPKPPARAHR